MPVNKKLLCMAVYLGILLGLAISEPWTHLMKTLTVFDSVGINQLLGHGR